MSRQEIEPGPPQVKGERSRKEPFEQLVNSYSEHLHMSVRPVENARNNVMFTFFSEPTNYPADMAEAKSPLSYLATNLYLG
jgi:hypothetical protein